MVLENIFNRVFFDATEESEGFSGMSKVSISLALILIRYSLNIESGFKTQRRMPDQISTPKEWRRSNKTIEIPRVLIIYLR
jgi:hypothetical protein